MARLDQVREGQIVSSGDVVGAGVLAMARHHLNSAST